MRIRARKFNTQTPAAEPRPVVDALQIADAEGGSAFLKSSRFMKFRKCYNREAWADKAYP